MLFRHICVASNDIEKSKKFYDAIFRTLNLLSEIDHKGRPYYLKDGQRFVITKPIDGKPATYSNGGTIGFSMNSPQQIDEWHNAGVKNGGISIEDPPGFRKGTNLYLAYLRDPDGNKLCAVYEKK